MADNWSFQDICDWALKTFGKAPDVAVLINRADKEFIELYQLIEPNDVGQVDFDPAEAAEEIADIVIVLAQACAFLGYDLQSMINAKMNLNVLRRWDTAGNGVGQHV